MVQKNQNMERVFGMLVFIISLRFVKRNMTRSRASKKAMLMSN